MQRRQFLRIAAAAAGASLLTRAGPARAQSLAVVVHPSQPMTNLAELVDLAKHMPGKLDYGSAGVGTPGHLTAEMFKAAAAIDIQHIPYKGSAPAVTDPLQSVLSNVLAGKLRALAISSKARSPVLPDVPTIAESGYNGFETTAWWGVFAPARMPDGLTATIAGEVERIVNSEAFRRQLEPLGVIPTVLSRDDFSKFQHSELAKWARAVHDGGIRID